MANHEEVKTQFTSAQVADYPFICPIVRGEILFGVKQLDIGRKRQSLEDQANNLFSTLECNPIPENTGDFYAEIKIVTKSNGKTLGESDLWIAATALALDAVLVTSDNDFYRIRQLYKSLQVKDWTVKPNPDPPP